MIPGSGFPVAFSTGKPRASGDDPAGADLLWSGLQ